MVKDIITGRSKFLQRIISIIPKELRLRLNPHRHANEHFIRLAAINCKEGSKILDAGAGPCPYKYLFSHCNYEATDFNDPHGLMDFVCSLDKIPKKDNSYDSIICVEVLEHVEFPQKVVNELHRVLKKNGTLYMTIPMMWQLHQEPYNFFYFTKYGIESILKQSGFKEYKIEPMGGYFKFLADAIRFNGIINQYKDHPLMYYPLKIIFFPFTDIVIPFILFHIDFLDKERKWTMGYLVSAKK